MSIWSAFNGIFQSTSNNGWNEILLNTMTVFRGRLWELSIKWYYTDMFAQLINWISLPFLHGKQHYTLEAEIMIIINADDFESGLDAFMEDRSINCSHSRLNVTLMRTIYKGTLVGKLSIRMPESLLATLRVIILD